MQGLPQAEFGELLQLHVLPILGKVQLQKLLPQHLQKLYNQKLEEGYAPQTVKHIHRVLHRALGDALRWQLVVRNVCDAVDPPRVPRKEMQALTGEQALQFLEAAAGDPLEALYVLALTTGMRQGELLGLKWTDLDLALGTVQVRFHDLRHSAASLLLSLGVHAKIVQELLGHSQIGLTLDTYSHVLPSLQEEAVNRLNTLLSKRV